MDRKKIKLLLHIKAFTISLTFLIAFCVAGYALDDLKDSDVTQFIATIVPAEKLTNSTAPLSAAQINAVAKGPMVPYTLSYERIKAAGKIKELELLTKEHGFQSPEAWANIGDRIMLAYMAILAESRPNLLDPNNISKRIKDRLSPEAREAMKDRLKAIEAIESESGSTLKDQLSPEARKAIEDYVKVTETVHAVSKNDIKIVRSHAADIEAAAKSVGYQLPD